MFELNSVKFEPFFSITTMSRDKYRVGKQLLRPLAWLTVACTFALFFAMQNRLLPMSEQFKKKPSDKILKKANDE